MEAKKNKNDITVTLEELRRDRKKRKKVKEELEKIILGGSKDEEKNN